MITPPPDPREPARTIAALEARIAELERECAALRESEARIGQGATERRLQEALQRLRYHAENSPLGVVERSADLRITAWNAAAERVFGWGADEVVGRRIDELQLVYPDDRGRVRALVQDLVSGARPRNVNANRNVRKDGEVIHCEWYNSALHDASGRLVSVLSLVLDVTARKLAEKSLREEETKYRNLFENMTEEVHFWRLVRDERGRIETWRLVDANPPALRTWGRSLGEVRGRTADEIFGAGATEHLREVVEKVMAAGVPRAYEDDFVLLDKYFRFTTIPLGDCFITTGADITTLKKAQTLVEEHNEALREANRRKDEFLAMLSHELRNPLAPIRNSIYVLSRVDAGSDRARRAKAIIERQTEHLTRLVDDLLDVTRIARGKVELRRSRLDLRDVVARAADDFRHLMEEGGVVLRIRVPDVPLWTDADGMRITQVVGNLLHNATKFTRSGDEVTLGLRAVGAEAEIRVADTGAGICPELLPHVFDAFVQGDSTLARTEGGLGLGLALVKGIAELHGGTARAESAGKGKGAELVVCLPLALEPRRALADPGRGRRVLVVDDHRDAADSLAQLVRMLGHAADVAYDGPSALEKARAAAPDVVLCDVGLPGLSGYEVAKALRAERSAIRLIAVTGYARAEDVRLAAEAGFDAHLAKPCDPENVERLLG